MITYLSPVFNEIFNEIYQITNGKIIVGGSLSLRMQNIVQRDISDIDLNLTKTDWDTFESHINKKYNIYHGPRIKIESKLDYIVSRCLTKDKSIEFHLFINNIEADLFNNIIYDDKNVRVFKPELHLLDKEIMLLDDSANQKIKSDIINIKKHINEK
jgi:hypothetical protein